MLFSCYFVKLDISNARRAGKFIKQWPLEKTAQSFILLVDIIQQKHNTAWWCLNPY